MFLNKRYALSILVALLLLNSCSDEETPFKAPDVPTIKYLDDMDQMVLSVTENVDLTYQWSTTSDAITLVDANRSTAYFKLPEGESEQRAKIKVTVRNKGGANEAEETISFPGLTTTRAYGLGRNLQSERSSDNNFKQPWYYDQHNTGDYSLVNCGPTSVTMAVKWANADFTGTPEDARNAYRSGGGWWYTDDIVNYLNDHDIENYYIDLLNFNVVKSEIDDGNIVILCLDMYYVTYLNTHFRYNKFYKTNATGWGHFIVVKGYKQVDGKLFYEVYDPCSLTEKYSDGTLKGKNRYYSSCDLDQATQNWWDYAIVITKDEGTGGRRRMDARSIKPMPGR
jgi:hypothetical protein